MDILSFWPALLGGAMIGAGAVVLMASTGRIMGVSGIVGALVETPWVQANGWRAAFLLGLILPGVILSVTGNLLFRSSGLGTGGLIIAGLLVGFGTRMGSGCTSGHGICGLARLSFRSLMAVLTFMAMAGAVVFVQRHLTGG